MRWRDNFAVVTLAVLFVSSDSDGFTYLRPVPELPGVEDPSKINDILKCTLAQHTHGTLFRLDDSNRPIPSLAENFNVSADGKIYEIKLRDSVSPAGKRITSRMVKLSLENAVRHRATNHENLSGIVGVQEFRTGRSEGISGIETPSDAVVRIRTRHREGQLLWTLADIRYAVWDVASGDAAEGFGVYRIDSGTADRLRLVRNDGIRPNRLSQAAVFEFLKMSKAEAFDAFSKGTVDDLFFFRIEPLELKGMRSKAHAQKSYSPRTYALFINARRVRDIERRRILSSRIDPRELVSRCYPGETYSSEMVPPGFIGRLEEGRKIPQRRGDSGVKGTLKVRVLSAMGGEQCVRDFLADSLRDYELDIAIVSLEELVESWIESRIDLFAAYIDAESSDSLFGDFSPSSRLKLGLQSDPEFDQEFQGYLRADGKVDKQRAAKRLSRHIQSLETVIPLFHPDFAAVYSRRFKKFNIPLKSPCFIQTENFMLAP